MANCFSNVFRFVKYWDDDRPVGFGNVCFSQAKMPFNLNQIFFMILSQGVERPSSDKQKQDTAERYDSNHSYHISKLDR